MSVIGQAGSDWQNREPSWDAGMSSRAGWTPARLRELIRASAIAAADIVAFGISAGAADALVWSRAAARMWRSDVGPAMQYGPALPVESLLILVGVLAYFLAQMHYQRRIPFWSAARQVTAASLFALLCSGFTEFSLKQDTSRLLVVGTWVVFPFAALLARAATRRVLDALGWWQAPVVVVGTEAAAEQAIAALCSEPSLGYSVVGVISPSMLEASYDGQGWVDVLQQFRAQLFVLTFDPQDRLRRGLMERLVRTRLPFAVMPQLSGLPVLGYDQTCFFSHDTVLFTYRNNLAKPVARFTKVVFDLCAASAALVVLAPVMLLIAATVKGDGGPILYTHPRVGARGRQFPCFKFRSMRVDSDAVLQRLLESDPAAAEEWAITQKLRRDPRVTRIGAILRATSLDELPQLLNVLRLEMSLVGPRPIVHREIPRYAEDIAYYYETRPGLTGLWQVSGRNDTSYAQRVQLDCWYVKNWTMWHDLAIIAKTVPAVLKRRGAV